MTALFFAIPCPAANGAGAAVDLSTAGRDKTIVVSGIRPGGAYVNIEINASSNPLLGSWAALCRFQAGGEVTLPVAAKWFRARTTGYKNGTPIVNIGTTDAGTTSADLPVSAGPGSGAAVDISVMPTFKTVQIGGTFQGQILIEVSTDGATEWAVVAAFTQGGQQSFYTTAHWARVTRLQPGTGTPVVTLAAADEVTGSGSVVGTPNTQARFNALGDLESDTDSSDTSTTWTLGATVAIDRTLASIAVGEDSIATGANTSAIGNACVASGTCSHAEGSHTTASGNFSHTEGFQTSSNGVASHAEGSSSIAGGINSHAEGLQTLASGPTSHAEGEGATAAGTDSHAEGFQTASNGVASHAEGFQTTASGLASHAEGENTIASANCSHAGGQGSTASGGLSFAHGESCQATAISSIALGARSKSSRDTQFALAGRANTGGGAAGSRQTSLMVADTTTPGGNPNQTSVLFYGDGSAKLILEDGKAYAFTVTAVIGGTQAGPVRKSRTIVIKFNARRDGGVSIITASGASEGYGDASTATWTLTPSVGVGPDGIVLTFGTGGGAASACGVCAEVSFQEVSY